MFVLRSHQPDTQTQPIGRLYAVTSETESLARSLAGAGQTFGRRGRRPEAVPDCDSDVARTSAKQATSSRNTSMLPLFASAFAVRFGGATAAIECPKHITDTQASIDRVSDGMECDVGRMPNDMVELVYALLDDARMLLGVARRNHEYPQGPYDHARAFAMADAALGHARAAKIIHSRCAQQRC
jgi:hypothetical protein